MSSIQDIIVHRGNSPVNKSSSREQTLHYVELGFKRIEIDIYATAPDTFKFCHPLVRDQVHEEYKLNDGFMEKLVQDGGDTIWLVDLKCLDLDEPPVEVFKYLTDSFRKTDYFVSAQREILQAAHDAGIPEIQYFRDDMEPDLGFTPFGYTQSADNIQYEKDRVVVNCDTPDQALGFVDQGYFGAMVDGDKLLAALE